MVSLSEVPPVCATELPYTQSQEFDNEQSQLKARNAHAVYIFQPRIFPQRHLFELFRMRTEESQSPAASLQSPSTLRHFKAMCLLIITSHSRCGHNTYRHGKCSENAAYLQCHQKRTELGTHDGKCEACDRWAALAWRTWEERVAWSHEMNIATQAERRRRRSTLWQDQHPLRDTAQSNGNGSPRTPSRCE